MVYVRGCQWRWNEKLGLSTGEAFNTAVRYLSEGEKHSSSLTNVAASQIHLYNERHDKAFTEAARAVALDPNDPEAHVAMALAMITTGRPEAGLEFVETALRLNPSHPSHYVLAHGMAYFSMDDLEQAAAVLAEALERDPDAVELAPLLAATYAQLGRREEARAALLQYRPGTSQSELINIGYAYHFPYAWAAGNRGVKNRINNGLYIAGLSLETTVPSLTDTLRQGNTLERQHAIQALKRFGPNAAAAVPALIETLGDDVRGIRKDAVIALGMIGPAAEAAIPALTAIQYDGDHVYWVNQALKKIRGK
jgi:Flp pilus assembly protein TadD